MSDRQRLLLSPYRLPTHHQVYLNEDEMAAWLNGFVVLWHPALLLGGEKPPRVDSAYDHEQPTAGRAYVMPESPPQFLPEDWPDRVRAAGALKLPAYPDRDLTLRAMAEAVRDAAQTDEGREHFGTPDQLASSTCRWRRCGRSSASGSGTSWSIRSSRRWTTRSCSTCPAFGPTCTRRSRLC